MIFAVNQYLILPNASDAAFVVEIVQLKQLKWLKLMERNVPNLTFLNVSSVTNAPKLAQKKL